jgi:hypothetical protein
MRLKNDSPKNVKVKRLGRLMCMKNFKISAGGVEGFEWLGFQSARCESSEAGSFSL